MVINVADDRKTATVRGRSMMQAGLHETQKVATPALGGKAGIYDNRYVCEDGVWKIARLGYFPFWHGSFADGWGKTPIDFIPAPTVCFPEDPLGPDYIVEPAPRLWPATDMVEFPYPHPVTGKPIISDNSRAREGFKD